jgi:hypothetical protein
MAGREGARAGEDERGEQECKHGMLGKAPARRKLHKLPTERTPPQQSHSGGQCVAMPED